MAEHPKGLKPTNSYDENLLKELLKYMKKKQDNALTLLVDIREAIDQVNGIKFSGKYQALGYKELS